MSLNPRLWMVWLAGEALDCKRPKSALPAMSGRDRDKATCSASAAVRRSASAAYYEAREASSAGSKATLRPTVGRLGFGEGGLGRRGPYHRPFDIPKRQNYGEAPERASRSGSATKRRSRFVGYSLPARRRMGRPQNAFSIEIPRPASTLSSA